MMRSIRDCHAVVVGGAGFLGSHVVECLLARDCSVLVLDNLHSGRREFVPKGADFEHFDITGSEDQLRGLFSQYGAEFVFNYAAWPYVPDSFSRPLHVFNVNAFGAMKVIHAAHGAGAKGILQVSSAELYGDCVANATKIRESAEVSPHSSYGASKAAIDYFVQCRWRESKVPCVSLRQFNCLGERETHPYVVPEIIGQLDRGAGTVSLGNNSSRDFMYAGDAARMAVELLERCQFGEVYNLGSQESVRIYDLAKLVGSAMGFHDVKVEEDATRKRPWEIWHLQSDNSKIRACGVSEPTVTLVEAIQRTVAWYRGNGCKWPWEK